MYTPTHNDDEIPSHEYDAYEEFLREEERIAGITREEEEIPTSPYQELPPSPIYATPSSSE